MGWVTQKLLFVKKMFQLLDIEPFTLLFVMCMNAGQVSSAQLTQDKLCLNKYNQTRLYCIELGKNKGNEDSDEPDQIANHILAEVTQYMTYTAIISTIPGLFFILFIASWMDSYIHGRKIVLCLGSLGYALSHGLSLLNSYKFDWDVNYLLINTIPLSMVGGWQCIWMTVYSFMANNSSKENRFIKFTSFEIATFIARPLSIYLGGVLLGGGNYQSEGNIHHYEWPFLLCLVCAVIAFLYVLLFINEKKTNNKKKTKNIDTNDNELKEETKDNNIEDNVNQISDKFEISKLINIKNFKEMFKTAIKVRPNRGRAKIWLLYASMCVLMLTDAKFFSILFPYTEKMYEWNGQQFSNFKSLASIIQVIGMPVVSLILSSYLKLSDTKLGVIGLVLISLGNICAGSITNAIGLYLLFIIGSSSSISSLAIRALLTKIAPESESGKIMALLGALEQLFATLENVILNSVFQFSIDFFPSLFFEMAAILNFIPLFIMFWIDLTQDQPKQ